MFIHQRTDQVELTVTYNGHIHPRLSMEYPDDHDRATLANTSYGIVHSSLHPRRFEGDIETLITKNPLRRFGHRFGPRIGELGNATLPSDVKAEIARVADEQLLRSTTAG
ncbi:hypothetical protein ES703_54083 [subsurface metagenome]